VGLSKRKAARQRQLSNLRRAPAPPAGNRRAVKSGAWATAKTLRVEPKVQAIYEQLAEEAPLRAPDGSLPAADSTLVELLALCLARLESVAAYLSVYGPLDESRGGAVRPAAEYERRLRLEARDHASALGLSPRARVALGLDLQRTVSLADAMSEPDSERRAELMRAAGVPIDADAEDEPDG
jgi:hypothetical protein